MFTYFVSYIVYYTPYSVRKELAGNGVYETEEKIESFYTVDKLTDKIFDSVLDLYPDLSKYAIEIIITNFILLKENI